MKLKSINIHRPYYHDDTQQYTGEVEFEGLAGKITLVLTDDLSRRVLAACADEIVSATTAQADALRNSVAKAVGILIDHQESAT